MDNASLNITVLIAGRPYPLKIKASDEEVIQTLVKGINSKVKTFQDTYPQKDKQDCLAMAVLTYAVELQKAKQTGINSSIDDKLDGLNNLLDVALSSSS